MATPQPAFKVILVMRECSGDQPSMGSALQVAPHIQGRIQWSTSRNANSAIRYTME